MPKKSKGRVKRQPRPFYRADRDRWYVELGGKQINLGPDETEAFVKYHEIMAKRTPITPTVRVGVIVENFLEYVEKANAPKTFEIYRDSVNKFVTYLSQEFPGLRACDLKPFHVSKFRLSLGERYSDNTLHTILRAVKRCFSWAAAQGLLDSNPVSRIEMPRKTNREIVVTPEQWDLVMTHAKGEEFRDLLTMYRETGARPGEIVKLEVRHIDVAQRRAVFERANSKGTRFNRVIYFTENAWAIVQKWMLRHKKGLIFRNQDGQAWTSSSVNCRLRRLKKHTGFKLMPYALRHTFATEGLKNGVDGMTVVQLMGHRDLAMVARVYGHLAGADDYLRQQLANVVSGPSARPTQGGEPMASNGPPSLE